MGDVEFDLYIIIYIYIYVILAGKDKTYGLWGWNLFWNHNPNCKIVWMKSLTFHKESTGKQNCNGSLLTQTIFLRYQLLWWVGNHPTETINSIKPVGKHSETLADILAPERKYPFLKVEKIYRESWELCDPSLDTSQPLKRSMRNTYSIQPGVTQDTAKRPYLQHSCVSVVLLHKRLAACEVNVSKEGSTSYLPKPHCNCQSFTRWKWSELSEWKTSSWRDICV